jgi:hypothetical protein
MNAVTERGDRIRQSELGRLFGGKGVNAYERARQQKECDGNG